MTIYITIGVLLALASIFQTQLETIWVTPTKSWFPNAPWWVANNYGYKDPLVQWLMRYPLSFAKDGWHLCKSIWSVLDCSVIVIALQLPWWWVVVFYILYGSVHNICWLKTQYTYKEILGKIFKGGTPSQS